MTEVYRPEPHAFTSRIVNYLYCSRCGLIMLRNDFTQWCVKMGCNYSDHPQYKAKRHEFTSPNRSSRK